MPKQPDAFDSVQLPGINGDMAIAKPDISGYAAGGRALAQGVENLGTGIEKAATTVAEPQITALRDKALLAQDSALSDAIGLRQKYKSDTDYATLPQRWQTDLDGIMEKHLSTIPEGPLRDQARARMQVPFAHEAASVSQQAFTQQRSDYRASLLDEADSLVNTTGAQDDPLHTAKVQQFGAKVQAAKDGGFLSPLEAETMSRNLARGVIDAEFRARFQSGRESAAQAVGDLKLAQAGVVGPTVNAWRAAGMPDHGIAGVLHNINEESKFNPSMRVPDQPRWSGEAHYAHGLYQEGGAEWNNYQTWLAGKGEGADWRDPALQSQFAAWNLKNNYPQTWSKMSASKSPEDAAAIYAKEYLKPASQFLSARLDRISRNGVRPVESYGDNGETPTGNPAYDILTPTHRDTLRREGESILKAYQIDEDRQQREAEKARKQASEDAENDHLKNILAGGGAYPDGTPVKTIDFFNDPRLTPEKREHLSALLAAKTGEKASSQEAARFGTAYWDRYLQIHPDDGQPQTLTHRDQLTPDLKNRAITADGYERLAKDIDEEDKRQGAPKLKAEKLKLAHGMVTGADQFAYAGNRAPATAAEMYPDGTKKFEEFNDLAEDMIDKERKKGTSWHEIFADDGPFFKLAKSMAAPAQIATSLDDAKPQGGHFWSSWFSGSGTSAPPRFTPPSGWKQSPDGEKFFDPRTRQIYDRAGKIIGSAPPPSVGQ